jgi:hypothetical protein
MVDWERKLLIKLERNAPFFSAVLITLYRKLTGKPDKAI